MVVWNRRGGKVCEGALIGRVSGSSNVNRYDLRHIRLPLLGEGVSHINNNHRHILRKVLRVPLRGDLPTNDNYSAFLRSRLSNFLAVRRCRASVLCEFGRRLARKDYPVKATLFISKAS